MQTKTRKDLPEHSNAAARELCLSIPIYEEVVLGDPMDLALLWSATHNFDGYCAECPGETIWHYHGGALSPLGGPTAHFTVVYRCGRREAHEMRFCFRARSIGRSWHLVKIGQWPSSADLADASLKHFRSALSDQDYRELKCAVGLAAHGVGIGSFVYLRRILERLVFATFRGTVAGSQMTEAALRRMRTDQRVELLKEDLPPFLVNNEGMFGILSKGIHELSEPECLRAFPLLRLGVEEVLNDMLRKEEAERRRAAVEKALGNLRSDLGRRAENG